MQAECLTWPIGEPFPQLYPQGAHSWGGVSAQDVHRPVHRVIRRRGPVTGRLSEASSKTGDGRRANDCAIIGWQRGRWHPVSVTEISPREGEFERTPPHDIAAEQC